MWWLSGHMSDRGIHPVPWKAPESHQNQHILSWIRVVPIIPHTEKWNNLFFLNKTILWMPIGPKEYMAEVVWLYLTKSQGMLVCKTAAEGERKLKTKMSKGGSGNWLNCCSLKCIHCQNMFSFSFLVDRTLLYFFRNWT